MLHGQKVCCDPRQQLQDHRGARRWAFTPGQVWAGRLQPTPKPPCEWKHWQAGAMLSVQHIWNLLDPAVLAETVKQSTHHCPILSCERVWRCILQHDGLGRGAEMVQGGISFDGAKTSRRGTLTESLRDDRCHGKGWDPDVGSIQTKTWRTCRRLSHIICCSGKVCRSWINFDLIF